MKLCLLELLQSGGARAPGRLLRALLVRRGECELFDRADVEAWAQMAPGEIEFNEEGDW